MIKYVQIVTSGVRDDLETLKVMLDKENNMEQWKPLN